MGAYYSLGILSCYILDAEYRMLKDISIKQKIILGFSGLGLLLLIGCALGFLALQQINLANTEVKEVAVPLLRTADSLRLKQITISKLISKTYSEQTKASVQKSRTTFANQMSAYQNELQRLKELTGNNSDFVKPLSEAIKFSEYIEQHATKLFLSKLSIISSIKKTNSLKTNLKTISNYASDAMLDLELIETDDERQGDAVSGTGVRIDDLLFTLNNSAKAISQLQHDTIGRHQEDMQFLIANIKNNFDYLKKQAAMLPVEDILSSFSKNFIRINSLLNTPGTLYETVTTKLNAQTQAQKSYEAAEQATESAQLALELLQNEAQKRFAYYQNMAEMQTQRAQKASIILAGSFLFLAIFIAYSTSKAMLGPLAAVNKMLGYLAGGDFSREMQKRNNDEFGMLIDNINRVKNNLKILLNDIN